jgi:RNA polymerase sigma factor for flagellar operon FliA
VQVEALAGLAEAFETLSERDRIVLTLSYFERLTLREIGEVLHITESRVSQLRTRALKRLQEGVNSLEEAA